MTRLTEQDTEIKSKKLSQQADTKPGKRFSQDPFSVELLSQLRKGSFNASASFEYQFLQIFGIRL